MCCAPERQSRVRAGRLYRPCGFERAGRNAAFGWACVGAPGRVGEGVSAAIGHTMTILAPLHAMCASVIDFTLVVCKRVRVAPAW